jgi:hypothetical protein
MNDREIELEEACERHHLNMAKVKMIHAGVRFEAEETVGICLCCKQERKDVARRRLNTAYVEDKRNWLSSCERCYEEAVEHYQNLWDDYWAQVM